MRAFLRYLGAEGKCTPGLDAAIPPAVCWRLSSLPGYLKAEEVERVLAASDTSTSGGLRDRALLLLLARLGLRTGDVRQLRLGDIDWTTGSLRLQGKGRREARLPLTQEIGDALLAYVERGRPAAPYDHVFLGTRPPIRPWGHSSVSAVVGKYLRRAGVTNPRPGTQVLRHSAATEMLRRGGSLQEIGAVLRHRSCDTTAIYAKVDVTLLKLVAQAWPEVPSC